jgi:hypothetical protein
VPDLWFWICGARLPRLDDVLRAVQHLHEEARGALEAAGDRRLEPDLRGRRLRRSVPFAQPSGPLTPLIAFNVPDARAVLQLDRVRAVLPVDRRHRTDAGADDGVS